MAFPVFPLGDQSLPDIFVPCLIRIINEPKTGNSKKPWLAPCGSREMQHLLPGRSMMTSTSAVDRCLQGSEAIVQWGGGHYFCVLGRKPTLSPPKKSLQWGDALRVPNQASLRPLVNSRRMSTLGWSGACLSSFFRTKGVSTHSFVHSEAILIRSVLLPARDYVSYRA